MTAAAAISVAETGNAIRETDRHGPILVVDGDDADRSLVAAILDRAGMRTVEVSGANRRSRRRNSNARHLSSSTSASQTPAATRSAARP